MLNYIRLNNLNILIMELKDFIENFAEQFDDTDASEIKDRFKCDSYG